MRGKLRFTVDPPPPWVRGHFDGGNEEDETPVDSCHCLKRELVHSF